MKNKILQTLFLILYLMVYPLYSISGQTILISTLDNEIYQLNEDYTVTQLASLTGLEFPIFDIAITPDSKLFGITGNKIIEIDLLNNSYTIRNQLPSENTPYASLTSNNEGELFTINNYNLNLYKYDPVSETVSLVTNLGFDTPGDLSFYKGQLIFPNFPNVKAYNLDSKELTDIFCIPSQNGLIWGLANIFDNCDGNRVIASTITNELWEFDIESGNTIVLDFENVLNSLIYGLASTNEHLASNCEGKMININCELSVTTYNLLSVKIYPNPSNEILNIESALTIDKIEIYDISGKLTMTESYPDKLIDISSLNKGLYLIKFKSDKFETIEKLIVE